MSHTPGPWKIHDDPTNTRFDIVRPWDDTVRPGNSATFGSYLGAHIATIEYVSGWGVPQKAQAEANARLIAAAPDLLDALVKLEVWLTDDCEKRLAQGWEMPREVLDIDSQALAAIRKATGEEK